MNKPACCLPCPLLTEPNTAHCCHLQSDLGETGIPSLKFEGPGLGVPHLLALCATLVNISSSKLSKLISWLSNLSRKVEWK